MFKLNHWIHTLSKFQALVTRLSVGYTQSSTKGSLLNCLPVSDAHTIVDIRTVVVEHRHTSVTCPAVLGSDWFDGTTRVTES